MLCLCMRARPLLSTSFPFTPKRLPRLKSCLSIKSAMSSSTTIEHVVLFKVKPDVDSSQVNTMVSSLSGLISLDPVLHLTTAPVLRTGSSVFTFTHILHSRYNSKTDLDTYSQHPNHLSVVRESVLPICDDIMAVDWVADRTPDKIVLPPGSAARLTFLKLKEDVGEDVKNEVLGVIKGIKEKFGGIEQITCGENFSPARAKGFSIASIAVFKGVKEMEEADSNQELVKLQKEEVKDHVESVIVVDYVVPSPSNL